jgi:hypothetical protein
VATHRNPKTPLISSFIRISVAGRTAFDVSLNRNRLFVNLEQYDWTVSTIWTVRKLQIDQLIQTGSIALDLYPSLPSERTHLARGLMGLGDRLFCLY